MGRIWDDSESPLRSAWRPPFMIPLRRLVLCTAPLAFAETTKKTPALKAAIVTVLVAAAHIEFDKAITLLTASPAC